MGNSLKSHCFTSALFLALAVLGALYKPCYTILSVVGCRDAAVEMGTVQEESGLWCLLVWAQGLDLKVIPGFIGGRDKIRVVSLHWLFTPHT